VKNGTGATTVFRYVGNATELASTTPISCEQILPVELSLLNFHGELDHQGLTLSAMKSQITKKNT
jgi:hypothetical protein